MNPEALALDATAIQLVDGAATLLVGYCDVGATVLDLDLAHIVSGEDAAVAEAMAERTASFYTGE